MEAAEALEKHKGLVRKIASRLKAVTPTSVELDDLIQAGNIGLLDSLPRYSAALGSFATFAQHRIHGAMVDELRRNDSVPRGTRRKARLSNKHYHDLLNRLGRKPLESEIAHELAITLPDYQKLLATVQEGMYVSFEDLSEEGFDPPEITEANDPVFQLQQQRRIEALTALVDSLKPQHRDIFLMHYEQDLTLKEIASARGCTESNVSSTLTRVIKRMRHRLLDH